jgi:hypothetical protein
MRKVIVKNGKVINKFNVKNPGTGNKCGNDEYANPGIAIQKMRE